VGGAAAALQCGAVAAAARRRRSGRGNGYSSLVHGIAVKRGKKLSHSNKSHVSFAHDQLVSQSHVN